MSNETKTSWLAYGSWAVTGQYRVGDTRANFDPDGFDFILPARGGELERTIRFTCAWGYKAPSGNWNYCQAPATWSYSKPVSGFSLREHRCSQHPKALDA